MRETIPFVFLWLSYLDSQTMISLWVVLLGYGLPCLLVLLWYGCHELYDIYRLKKAQRAWEVWQATWGTRPADPHALIQPAHIQTLSITHGHIQLLMRSNTDESTPAAQPDAHE